MRGLRLALALCYALLGPGPGWAALTTAGPPQAMACDRGACACALPGQQKAAAKACCCHWKRALLKKFPELAQEPGFRGLLRAAEAGACSVGPAPCGGGKDPLAPASSRPQLRPQGPVLTIPGSASMPGSAALIPPLDPLCPPPEAVPKG
jgi:hypothetical protein